MTENINGLDRLMRQYGALARVVVGQSMKEAIGGATHLVQGEAKLMCPVNDGELRQSIRTVVESHEGNVRGVVYTNKKYAPYVELGTGPAGEADHAGISPEVSPVYTQSPWWIHESQIDQATAERYRCFFIDTPQGRFYQTSGQAAQPFMYPALKNNEERVTRYVSGYLSRKIREAAGER